MSQDILASLCKLMKDTKINSSKSASDTKSKSDNDMTCDDCGSVVIVQGNELVCNGCGVIKMMDDDQLGNNDNNRIVTYRIKIVGKDGSQFQHDLDKSAP